MKKLLFFALIVLFGSQLTSGQEKIISYGDVWQYYDNKEAPPKEWTRNNQLTAQWEKGESPLGYGDDRIKTILNFGDDERNKDITKYFKKTFGINDPYAFLVYELKVQIDDGTVLYLNGRELLRNNMPQGEITDTTRALAFFTDEEKDHSTIMLSEEFTAGDNTLSASVHQVHPKSSDCSFNLELIGHNNPKMISMVLKEKTIKNLAMDSKIRELTYSFELEKKDLSISFLEKNKSNLKVGLLCAGLIALGLLLGLYFVVQDRAKKLKELNESLKNIKVTVEQKDKKLLSSSLNVVHNQQFLLELKNLLAQIKEKDYRAVSKDIQNVVSKIEYNIHDENWLNLLTIVNSVHTGFVDRLTNLHSTLSETQLRHCIFIKLHLETKEIAQLLHINPRSVQAARYRIKKILNLNEATDLRDYLQKI